MDLMNSLSVVHWVVLVVLFGVVVYSVAPASLINPSS